MSAPSLSGDKQSLTDLALIRLADAGNGDALVTLATTRLPYLRKSLLQWCDAHSANSAYEQIADLTIYTAVAYARYIPEDKRDFEPADWLQRIAVLVQAVWCETNGLTQQSRLDPPPSRSTADLIKRRAEAETIKHHFDNLKIPGHKAILEAVMIHEMSPEAAGTKLNLGTDEVARIFYRAALEELLTLVNRHDIMADTERVVRCLARLPLAAHRDMLTNMLNHSMSTQAAAEQLPDVPDDAEQFYEDALRELYSLMLDDWRCTWRHSSAV